MAKKKNYYYVMVLTEEGPKYVTSIGDHHTAHWDMLEKPMEFSKEWAEDITRGLLLNFINAVMVVMPIEIDNQPFRYNKGKFEWKWNEEDKEDK